MGQTANTGGFIREFVPEKNSFVPISESDVALAIDPLDHRPRKCRGLVESREVFMKQPHWLGAQLYLRIEGAGGGFGGNDRFDRGRFGGRFGGRR